MLAEKLGMTVAELLGKISSYELSEWMKYLEIKAKEEERASKRRSGPKPSFRGGGMY